ncbi:MAG: ATP-binding protein, partial [Chryseolinea sp.]
NVNYMEKLIDGLLAFSKMGRQRLSKSMTPMESMVKELCSSIKERESSRSLEFDITELPCAPADPMLIRQVWTNLLSNAVKFTGKKANSIIAVGFKDHGNRIEYFVKDNGAGFDMKYKDRLFGMFQRMHSQREFEGVGIGLSIAEQIVQKHDGKIWVEAEVEKGATFHFELPK